MIYLLINILLLVLFIYLYKLPYKKIMSEEYLASKRKFKFKNLKDDVMFTAKEVREKTRFSKLKTFLYVVVSIYLCLFILLNFIIPSFVTFVPGQGFSFQLNLHVDFMQYIQRFSFLATYPYFAIVIIGIIITFFKKRNIKKENFNLNFLILVLINCAFMIGILYLATVSPFLS